MSQCKAERPIQGGIEYCIHDDGEGHRGPHLWPAPSPPPRMWFREDDVIMPSEIYRGLKAEIEKLRQERDTWKTLAEARLPAPRDPEAK